MALRINAWSALLLATVVAACSLESSTEPCEEGATQCTGTVIVACADGSWQAVEDCADSAKVCKMVTGEAACVEDHPACQEGDTRCQGDIIETCTGGAFTATRDCADDDRICALDDDTGHAACETPPVCSADESRCDGTRLEVCEDGQWALVTDCTDEGKVCELEASSGEAACVFGPECQDGESRCTGTVVEVCTDGAFVADVDCSDDGRICEHDIESGTATCVPDACVDGEGRCDGTRVRICVQGVFTPGDDCADSGRLCEVDPASGVASCVEPPCEAGTTRCTADVIETCNQGSWATGEDCAASGRSCDDAAGPARCVGFVWQHLPVEIQDDIMQGTSLMLPADNPTYAYDPQTDLFITRYSRDYFEPTIAYLWYLDAGSGVHSRGELAGDLHPIGENFCVDGSDWCQFLAFDAAQDLWVVLGSSTASVMSVDAWGVAALTQVNGSHPPDSWINHTHRFAWDARKLFLYGATGPSGFGHTLYAFDLDTAVWSAAVTGLPQVDDNCLVFEAQTGQVITLGGRETHDGGDSHEVLDTCARIDPSNGAVVAGVLPAGIGPRRALNCAYDPGRHWVYVLGGSLIHDRWDEIENEYHNDLWVLDLQGDSWEQLMPDADLGHFEEPDQYGDRAFVGNPAKPNFGKNRGLMTYDTANDRLIVIGEVPIFTHAQIYFLDLADAESLLSR